MCVIVAFFPLGVLVVVRFVPLALAELRQCDRGRRHFAPSYTQLK